LLTNSFPEVDQAPLLSILLQLQMNQKLLDVKRVLLVVGYCLSHGLGAVVPILQLWPGLSETQHFVLELVLVPPGNLKLVL